MPMTSREMIQYLKANGFVQVGSNGSHRKFWNERTKKTVIVPFNAKDLKPGTEDKILKMAGLKNV